MYPVIYYLLVTAIAVLLVLIAMPSVIHVAQRHKLFDDNAVSRKEHSYGIPRLGGIAFCISILLTSLIIAKTGTDLPIYDIYAATTILFLVGVKDDLSGVHCSTKLAVQAVTAFIITVPANIRITDLHGIINIYKIAYVPSILISVFVIMFIINSFNLIDGIDGLAGTIGVISCCTFGISFMMQEQHALAALAMSAAGALIVFLAYNYSPARIFMGDAGSLFLGLISAIFAIKFISVNEASTGLNMHAAPAFAMAVLIIPAFDTCSVIITRIINKKSPFKPDRNHIHHRMLRLGLTHMQTTFTLCSVNLLFIGFAILFSQADTSLLLLIFIAASVLMNGAVNLLIRVKAKQPFALAA